MRLASVVVLLLLAFAAPAEAGEPTPQELLAAKLETLRRILPDGPEVGSGLDGLRRAIERAALTNSFRLEGMSTVAQMEVLAKDVGYVPVDVSAVLRPSAELDPKAVGSALAGLVESLSRSPRLLLVDRLAFEAQPDGTLRFSARISRGFRPTAPLLEGAELLSAKVATIEREKLKAVWPHWRLRALSGEQSPPIYLTSLTLEGSGFDARGVAPWPAQVRDWAPLSRVGITSMEWQQPDACQHFAVRATFPEPPDGSPGAAWGPPILVGRAVDERCRMPEASALRLPTIRASGQGPLMLRGRDIDLADAVLLLGRMAGQDLVVDGDVAGRLDVELRGMTLETALAALEPLGFSLSPPGRPRRVTRGTRPNGFRAPGSESPVMGAPERSGGAVTGLAGIRGDQLELSALATSGKTWSAWMVTPYGALLEYKAGDRFLDGQVLSVDASGVELRVELPDSSPLRYRDRRLTLDPAP